MNTPLVTPPARDFSIGQAAAFSGLTLPMVNYLCRSKIIKPSNGERRGRGVQRLFSFGDLVVMRAVKRLLDGGVTVYRLRRGLEALRSVHPEITETFAIERAVKEWTDRELLITTAILQESNFYFMGGSEAFFAAVESELQIVIASRPVQIALPYIYRHKPLFCVPLFHELGHFVDNDNKIVDTSLLLSPATSGPDLPDLPTSSEIATMPDLERSLATAEVVSHRQEYFADLFSASYVGNALSGFLQEFCPNQPKSESHPSSECRDRLLADFSSGTPNPIIEMFQEALKARGLPELRARATSIALEATFGSVRPFTPASDEELFGLFESAWNFLQTQWTAPTGPWMHFPEDDRVRLVNDLTEKSIRNHMLVEGWNASIDQQ